MSLLFLKFVQCVQLNLLSLNETQMEWGQQNYISPTEGSILLTTLQRRGGRESKNPPVICLRASNGQAFSSGLKDTNLRS